MQLAHGFVSDISHQSNLISDVFFLKTEIRRPLDWIQIIKTFQDFSKGGILKHIAVCFPTFCHYALQKSLNRNKYC